MKALFSALFLLMAVQPSHAQTANDFAEARDLLNRESGLDDLNSRAELISAAFIGRPYLPGGPLGEGPSGKYDQDPLFRFDGFDCTTFVETVTALARSINFDDFADQLNHIRYLNGVIDFTYRNHFVEIDWNPNNEAAGFLKDITQSLGSSKQIGDAVQTVSKRDWYQSLTVNDLRIPEASPELLQQRVKDLNNEGQRFSDVVSHLPYLKKEFISSALAKLKSPAVINIVRDVKDPSGKSITMVTHQVLLVLKQGKIRIRQASSKTANMKVIDQSLEQFAQDQVASATTRGINVLQLLTR